jgi:hypothetical protein
MSLAPNRGAGLAAIGERKAIGCCVVRPASGLAKVVRKTPVKTEKEAALLACAHKLRHLVG